MLFFLLIPAILFFLAGVTLLALLLRRSARTAVLGAYLFAASIGATVGFFVFNLLLLVLWLLAVWLSGRIQEPAWLLQSCRVLLALALFLGPLLSSACGLVIGCFAGLLIRWRSQRRTAS